MDGEVPVRLFTTDGKYVIGAEVEGRVLLSHGEADRLARAMEWRLPGLKADVANTMRAILTIGLGPRHVRVNYSLNYGPTRPAIVTDLVPCGERVEARLVFSP